VRTALLLHFPGVEPGRITRLTSHADIAPTTLRLLGVTAPPEDYCQGLDMLGPEKRGYAVSATYQRAAIITGDGTRIIFPMKSYRFSTLELRDAGDKRVSNRAELLELHGPKLGEVLRAAGRFKR